MSTYLETLKEMICEVVEPGPVAVLTQIAVECTIYEPIEHAGWLNRCWRSVEVQVHGFL